jgi:hypothetical protein
MTSEPDLAGRLMTRVMLIWAGLCLCMALLAAAGAAAPAYGPSPWASGVLRLYNGVQLGALLLLALLALCSPRRRRSLLRLSAPAMALAVQALWLAPLPPSSRAGGLPDAVAAPSAYAAVEALKLVWLLMVGFGSDRMSGRVCPARARRSSWAPIPPIRPISDRAWPPFPGR